MSLPRNLTNEIERSDLIVHSWLIDTKRLHIITWTPVRERKGDLAWGEKLWDQFGGIILERGECGGLRSWVAWVEEPKGDGEIARGERNGEWVSRGGAGMRGEELNEERGRSWA